MTSNCFVNEDHCRSATRSNSIVQCTQFQSYGHTKINCTRPFACVKCGRDHNTSECTKKPTTPATCVLSGGAHPANYKGCDVYRRLQTTRGASAPRPRPPTTRFPTPHVNTGDARHFPSLPHTQPPVPLPILPSASYSHAVVHGPKPVDLRAQLSAFLTKFKTLFSQLMEQTGPILTMLTAILPRFTA